MSDVANDMETATVNRYLKRFRERDRQTWKRFIACYVPYVYDICRRNGCSGAIAQQVTEETIRDVCHEVKSHRQDSSERSMQTWLATIATHRLSESGVIGITRDLPSTASANGATQTMAMPGIQQLSPVQTLGIIVRGALESVEAEFPPREMETFRRTVIQAESSQQVAEDMGESVAWVFDVRYRILSRLRQMLQED
ncbi:MAG: hypothetical protein O2955_19760 [Planctomycetota bacterium]|nr:hypothetical protein [Planctomycetota bacterium]MDA1214751.1 hypothetical protein [Planctomycetota bacterium]